MHLPASHAAGMGCKGSNLTPAWFTMQMPRVPTRGFFIQKAFMIQRVICFIAVAI